jgi:hypothetical protein
MSMSMSSKLVLAIASAIVLSACSPDIFDANMPQDEGDGERMPTSGLLKLPPFPGGHLCTTDQIDEILDDAEDSGKHKVEITCSPTLPAGKTVTKQLNFSGAAASDLTLDCNGSTIDGTWFSSVYPTEKHIVGVRSSSYWENGEKRWSRPSNVTIKNCKIIGHVRVWGMSNGGADQHLIDSSKKPGHSERARANAPTHVVLDKLEITATNRVAVYFHIGVSYSKLINSVIKGTAKSVSVYLDAESTRNTIKDNEFHASSQKREVIALDGSSHNLIEKNWFSSLQNGGIFLYRNCGEWKFIRHATPSHNQIINNVFYYNTYSGSIPAVWIGSRDGKTAAGTTSYCDDDEYDDAYGNPILLGSAGDNRDLARHNVAMHNRVFKLNPQTMFKVRNPAINSPNYVGYNETVAAAPDRPSACYVPSGYRWFVDHGEQIDVFRDANGLPKCTGYTVSCGDGKQYYGLGSSCSLAQAGFSCQVTANNAGCHKVAACPAGRKIVGARAACNLEWGTVTAAELSSVPGNKIRVVRPSDNVSDGYCYVGECHGSLCSNLVQQGERTIVGIEDGPQAEVGCQEHDKNGGDCHIKGTLYCR